MVDELRNFGLALRSSLDDYLRGNESDRRSFEFNSKQVIILNAKQAEDAAIDRLTQKGGAKSEDPCIKCKGYNVTFTIRQLRGGDEGASTIFLCTDCGESWRRDTGV